MAHKKLHLPEKTCEHCQRPFCWRRKWARDWENVKYCSQRCKRAAHSSSGQLAVATGVPANLCAAGSVEDEF
ncbi:MAG: hypothetical protein CSH37_11020 [Thalassolituus sp.]|nr:DUF2256 domain-containing protein [Pseudomonadota bacterium]TNC84426.1 MAG: hypothetical protein CSH37_11020 [Thalassolituus sp.]